MRIVLHIGPPGPAIVQHQRVLADHRAALAERGVLFARSPGHRNHTPLFLAVTDPGRIDPLRWARGIHDADTQAHLRDTLLSDLQAEIGAAAPEMVILSAAQLISLRTDSERARLRALLLPISDDIRIVAHLDHQARVLVRHYGDQIVSGRRASLKTELSLAGSGDWSAACLDHAAPANPRLAEFPEIQAPPFWLDYARVKSDWQKTFGSGRMALHAETGDTFATLGVPGFQAGAARRRGRAPHSAATLTRGRLLNEYLLRALETGRVIPPRLWRGMMADIAIPGAPIDPGTLGPVSDAFAEQNRILALDHPDLAEVLSPIAPTGTWSEADPEFGYRASQYMAVFLPRIDAATRAASPEPATAPVTAFAAPNPAQGPLNSDRGKEVMGWLKKSVYAPHNDLGTVDETTATPAFGPGHRICPDGPGRHRVIVGCMKNEGPYILEWLAYHRAIGFDRFLIYSNDCDDGTDAILARLDALGQLHHRVNDDWADTSSPQQSALNRAAGEDVVRDAKWISHIDIDEFINIRTGNGTLDDLFAATAGATNIAMTWRHFGHNGIASFRDDLVIDQFDACAPKFCPKPHTAWGFKSLYRNIGAYGGISCHRPRALSAAHREKVAWVNGSGAPMGARIKERGWRNSTKSIGYDLVQLNHYAVRSAEAFLIKRARGRALHVERPIDIRYWVRRDWNDHRDLTIKRNLPRLRREMARLLEDQTLKTLHEKAVRWHQDSAARLREDPRNATLYDSAVATRLAPLERIAYAQLLEETE